MLWSVRFLWIWSSVRAEHTTSIHAHSLPSASLPLFPETRTIAIVMATAIILPQIIPSETLFTCRLTPGTFFHPQRRGQNWEYTRTHMIHAWTPNARSLKRTVGSGLTGWREAYCARTTGEYRNTAVLMV